MALNCVTLDVLGLAQTPKILFSVNDMLFSNSYINYIMSYFEDFKSPLVSRHFQRMKI